MLATWTARLTSIWKVWKIILKPIFADLKTFNVSNEFAYNEKYVANKNLLNYFMKSNNQLIDQVKDLNEIWNDMVKWLPLSCQCKQNKSRVALQNLPVKYEKNIQTDSSLGKLCNKNQNKNLAAEISYHSINFVVEIGNENNENKKMKNISQNQIDSVDKETICPNILNDQLTHIWNLHHQRYLN